MRPIMQAAFAICFAVAMLMGGDARVENHRDITLTYVGDCACSVETTHPVRNGGKIAPTYCDDSARRVRVFVHYINNTTTFSVGANKCMLKDELRLRTALGGFETPE